MNIEKLTVGPLQCNCYIVSDPDTDESIIIDPGGDPTEIIDCCNAADLEVCSIVATHAHADHIGALPRVKREFGDANVCVGEQETEIMNDSLCNLAKMVGLDLELPDPDRLLAEGDEIDVGGETLKVLHTPGHTPGAISLLAEGEGPPVVFCGDLVFRGSVGRTDLPGGDRDALRRAIEDKILTLSDDTIVLPGHERETTVGDERDAVTYL